MGKSNTVWGILSNTVISFMLFILVLGVLNVINWAIYNSSLDSIVSFINSNFLLIVLITILSLFGEIFMSLKFPFDMPGPLFTAVNSIFIIKLIFNIFLFTQNYITINFPYSLDFIYLMIATLVFIIILIVDYIKIFLKTRKKKKRVSREE